MKWLSEAWRKLKSVPKWYLIVPIIGIGILAVVRWGRSLIGAPSTPPRTPASLERERKETQTEADSRRDDIKKQAEEMRRRLQ